MVSPFRSEAFRNEAQKRADHIRAFDEELAALDVAGALNARRVGGTSHPDCLKRQTFCGFPLA